MRQINSAIPDRNDCIELMINGNTGHETGQDNIQVMALYSGPGEITDHNDHSG